MRALLVALSASLVVFTAAACTPTGSYDGGNTPDAGPGSEGVSLDDIGAPCIYDPRTGQNPTNQCAAGLVCVIQTPQGEVNPLGMSLGSFENQFTVALPDGTFEGYCSVVGNAVAPPSCPLGSTLKLVRAPAAAGGFAAFCVKTCESSAECGGSRVCDARFLDLQQNSRLLASCVKPCTFDVPDCTLSGVTLVPTEGGSALATVVDGDSFSGGGTCARSTGICQVTPSRGLGDKGAPCATSADCSTTAACFQDELFGKDTNDGGLGFCATRCLLTQDGQSVGCGAGSVCQPGLLFGYQFDAFTGGVAVVRDPFTGAFTAQNGVCFSQCQQGLDTCDAFVGTHCDAIDGQQMGANTVGVSMCVPNEVALQQQ
jgi:hypothetical protein